MRDDRQLWGEKYTRSADDVLKVEGEIAATIARTLRGQLSGEEQQKLARGATADPEAYRLYLKGRDFRGGQPAGDGQERRLPPAGGGPGAGLRAGPRQAWRRPTPARPSCAGAAGRSRASKARAAVARALELDPDLAEAHAALGSVLFYFEWDWAGAEAEFRRALALNPGSQRRPGGVRELPDRDGPPRRGPRPQPRGVAPRPALGRPGPRHRDQLHGPGRLRAVGGELPPRDRDRPQLDLGLRQARPRLWPSQKKCPEAIAQAEIAEARIAGGAAPLSRSWLGATYGICGETARARQKLDELHALAQKQYVDPVDLRRHPRCASARSTRRWAGTRRRSRTGRRTWSTRPWRPGSTPSSPPTRATRRSSAAWRSRRHRHRRRGKLAASPMSRSPRA